MRNHGFEINIRYVCMIFDNFLIWKKNNVETFLQTWYDAFGCNKFDTLDRSYLQRVSRRDNRAWKRTNGCWWIWVGKQIGKTIKISVFISTLLDEILKEFWLMKTDICNAFDS